MPNIVSPTGFPAASYSRYAPRLPAAYSAPSRTQNTSAMPSPESSTSPLASVSAVSCGVTTQSAPSARAAPSSASSSASSMAFFNTSRPLPFIPPHYNASR